MDFLIKCYILFAIIFATSCTTTTKRESTLVIDERIRLLKDQLNFEISKNKYKNDPELAFHVAKIAPINIPDTIDGEYDDEPALLTPIMKEDLPPYLTKKIKTKPTPSTTKAKKIEVLRRKTTTTAAKKIKDSDRTTNTTTAKKIEDLARTTAAKNIEDLGRTTNTTTAKKNNIGRSVVELKDTPVKSSKLRKSVSKVNEVFYRRAFDSFTLEEKQLVQCQDLITPFYLGHKKNMTERKRIPVESGVVKRLVQLMTAMTPEHTKDEIFSIMFQISKLSIRLFQWETPALQALCYAITKKLVCSHKWLKLGLKKVFNSWHLDMTNTSNLRRKARLFRPPCVTLTPNGGSTKSPRSSFYSLATDPSSTKRL